MEGLLERSALLQTLTLLCAYAAMTFWEARRPLHAYGPDSGVRLRGNFGLMAVNHGLPYLVLPLLTLFSAWLAAAFGLGLLQGLQMPLWLAVPVGVLALDGVAWALHRTLHAWGPLWRVHRVHHSDLRFDSALGFRFHPLEALLLAVVNVSTVLALGLPPEAVLLSNVLTIAHNFFVHGNVRLSPGVEARLRRLIVTPDLHRVHHSATHGGSMSNFGIVLTLWDRLARTLRVPAGDVPDCFGLEDSSDPQRLALGRLLVMPFRRRP